VAEGASPCDPKRAGVRMMSQPSANDDQAAGRARARRTALVIGLVAVAIYLIAIGDVVLRR